MAQNIAARRAAEAQRRKVIVAQKRKLEIEANSTLGRSASHRRLPFSTACSPRVYSVPEWEYWS